MATDYWCLINYCDCYSLSKSLVEVMPIHVILRSWYDTANNVSLECHCWKKSRILQNKIILWTGLQPTASKLSPPVHRLAVPLLSSHQLAGLGQTSANFLSCDSVIAALWSFGQHIRQFLDLMRIWFSLWPCILSRSSPSPGTHCTSRQVGKVFRAQSRTSAGQI